MDAKETLLTASRQYRHNNSDETVEGYDKKETRRIVSGFQLELNRINKINVKLTRENDHFRFKGVNKEPELDPDLIDSPEPEMIKENKESAEEIKIDGALTQIYRKTYPNITSILKPGMLNNEGIEAVFKKLMLDYGASKEIKSILFSLGDCNLTTEEREMHFIDIFNIIIGDD